MDLVGQAAVGLTFRILKVFSSPGGSMKRAGKWEEQQRSGAKLCLWAAGILRVIKEGSILGSSSACTDLPQSLPRRESVVSQSCAQSTRHRLGKELRAVQGMQGVPPGAAASSPAAGAHPCFGHCASRCSECGQKAGSGEE